MVPVWAEIKWAAEVAAACWLNSERPSGELLTEGSRRQWVRRWRRRRLTVCAPVSNFYSHYVGGDGADGLVYVEWWRLSCISSACPADAGSAAAIRTRHTRWPHCHNVTFTLIRFALLIIEVYFMQFQSHDTPMWHSPLPALLLASGLTRCSETHIRVVTSTSWVSFEIQLVGSHAAHITSHCPHEQILCWRLQRALSVWYDVSNFSKCS